MKFTSVSLRASLILFCTTPVFSAAEPMPSSESTPARIAAGQEIHLLEKFDQNGDHRLDATERQTARAYLAKLPMPDATPAPGRPGTPPPLAIALEPVKVGEKMNPASVQIFPDRPLYDAGILRTLFLEFENTDWEKELTEFARTDILLPAQLKLDGRDYTGIGVRFHTRVATPVTSIGYKRALDLTLDYTIAGQAIGHQHQLRLLDAETDPTLLRTLLYSHIARHYLHAPDANLVQVVINGENWGIYVSVEPFDANFIQENFGTVEGSRWFASPGGNLAYLGDQAAAYRDRYHLISDEDPAAWAALMDLCKIINQTPPRQIETTLAKRLDIDSALRFFALENALINQEGYGGTTGGYGLYLGSDGRFQFVPQDAEASLRLIEVSEFEKQSRRPNHAHENPAPDEAKTAADKKLDDPASREAAKLGYNPNNFPRQAVTDLAMLLSYSFVNKADSDFNSKVSREEWLAFARSWFLVMDEDLVGKLTRDQFLAKFRGLLTPASIADGRTKQTFGKDDAAGIIGQDFFKVLDQNHDGQLTSQEVSDTFAQWFSQWRDPKTGVITQPALQRAFNLLFSQTIFQAEQSYIARRDAPMRGDEERGRGRHGGNGIGLGSLRIGGHGGRGGESRTLVTFSEELDPLAGLDEPAKPLLTKLLSVPVLRARYLEYVRDINENWLDWSKLGPVAKQYHELIANAAAKETHKATSYAHFVQEFDQDTTGGSRDGGAAPSLKNFVTERHGYLLKDENVMGTAGQ